MLVEGKEGSGKREGFGRWRVVETRRACERVEKDYLACTLENLPSAEAVGTRKSKDLEKLRIHEIRESRSSEG